MHKEPRAFSPSIWGSQLDMLPVFLSAKILDDRRQIKADNDIKAGFASRTSEVPASASASAGTSELAYEGSLAEAKKAPVTKTARSGEQEHIT
eukprot:801690-Pelagomonas_calceolata.AAC.4